MELELKSQNWSHTLSESQKYKSEHNPVRDPGFPREECTNFTGGVLAYYLAKFLPKTA